MLLPRIRLVAPTLTSPIGVLTLSLTIATTATMFLTLALQITKQVDEELMGPEDLRIVNAYGRLANVFLAKGHLLSE